MSKILVSMIAYRERQLAESVRDCYEKSDNPDQLIFSVISEQSNPELHADLSFIPENQLVYRKYDLSKYRGVLWSRDKTTEVSEEYDYILYTCGHNLFAPGWDTLIIEEYEKAKQKNNKVLITVSGPEYELHPDWSINYSSRDGRVSNMYRPQINDDYVPGYSFPKVELVPQDNELHEDYYLQFSWVFAPREFVDEVPLDPDMCYHGEEIYVTVQAWCRGWRFYATPKILYYHNTHKEYPDEEHSRMMTHRPWSDMNKNAFWKQSDDSMLKLNQLLSGKLTGRYGDISRGLVLEYCKKSGLNPAVCIYNPRYDKLPLHRHAEDFRFSDPIILD
jgi:Glycosyltransferase (GlcNAc)